MSLAWTPYAHAWWAGCAAVDAVLLALFWSHDVQSLSAVTGHNALLLLVWWTLAGYGSPSVRRWAMRWIGPLAVCLSHVVFLGRHLFVVWSGADWWAKRYVPDTWQAGQPVPPVPWTAGVLAETVGDIWLHVVIVWRTAAVRRWCQAEWREAIGSWASVDLQAWCTGAVLLYTAVWCTQIDPAQYYRIAPVDRYFYGAFLSANTVVTLLATAEMTGSWRSSAAVDRALCYAGVAMASVLGAIVLSDPVAHAWALALCWPRLLVLLLWTALTSTSHTDRWPAIRVSATRWMAVGTVLSLWWEQCYWVGVGNDLRSIVPEPTGPLAAWAGVLVVRAGLGTLLPCWVAHAAYTGGDAAADRWAAPCSMWEPHVLRGWTAALGTVFWTVFCVTHAHVPAGFRAATGLLAVAGAGAMDSWWLYGASMTQPPRGK